MDDLIHTSRVRIVKDGGPARRACIENFPEPVRYGVHGGIKKFSQSVQRGIAIEWDGNMEEE